MTLQLDSIIEEIKERIGDRPFYSISELVKIGLFGSVGSAREALLSGQLPFIKISKRRTVVPRESVINFLRLNFSSVKGGKCQR